MGLHPGRLGADPVSAASVLKCLRAMTKEQFDRWKQGRFNAFSHEERKALEIIEAERKTEVQP